MIIVDFQHLSYRNLFTCLYNCKPRKKEGKYITEDFIDLYFYQMLTSLNKITRDFSNYGEIVIALDGFKNWRKDFIEREYKGSRAKTRKESDVNFEEFFEFQKKLENFLKGFVKVLRVDRAEADDIGFVLSKYSNEKTLLITSDKDWRQHLIDNLNVDLYDPIKNGYLSNSIELQNSLKVFRVHHILIGDKADDVPNVMYNTELHKDFISYLNSLKLDIKIPSELDDFIEKNGNEILENYEGEIYKTPRFGEKTAFKLMKNPTEFIKTKVKDKKRFYKNFHLNRILVDSRKIPDDIKKEILEKFKEIKLEKPNGEFIEKHNLRQCYSHKLGKKTIEDCLNTYEDDFNDLMDLF